MTKVSLGRKSPWMENRRILFWCGSAANKSGTFSMASPLEHCDLEISLVNHGMRVVRH